MERYELPPEHNDDDVVILLRDVARMDLNDTDAFTTPDLISLHEMCLDFIAKMPDLKQRFFVRSMSRRLVRAIDGRIVYPSDTDRA